MLRRALRHASTAAAAAPIDLLVVGTGAAGCATALKAAAAGLRTTVLTSATDATASNTYWAQGGIIYKAVDDTPALLAQDVHAAGAGLCDAAAVSKLAEEGPKAVEDLLLGLDFGALPFDVDAATGALALCLEASHNRARIIHHKDATGKAISTAMVKAVQAHPGIAVRTGCLAADLAVAADGSGRVVGAHVLAGSGALELVPARHTLLATGGLGEVFEHSSNPPEARGDGVALAKRVGAAVHDLQCVLPAPLARRQGSSSPHPPLAPRYVQFHPTTLYIPGERRFLLTEALRGEGAVLRNSRGEAFAKRYHEDGELAPRDVVSRMIAAEMEADGSEHAFLDISHRDGGWLRDRFPTLHAHCLARGLDMAAVPLPVVPAQHYSCGGVATDLDGRTSVDGLWAAGEVACTGLHGANRLASTSLLEGLVWGSAAAEAVAARLLDEGRRGAGGGDAGIPAAAALEHPGAGAHDPAAVARLWRRLRSTMWERVGIKRTPGGLEAACGELREIGAAAGEVFEASAVAPETLALRNAAAVGLEIADAARAAPVSAGAHFVVPDEDEDEARAVGSGGVFA